MKPCSRADGNVPHVKSAARALAVLEFLDEIRRPATATEIGARLTMPTSSTSVLLRSLVALGYLSCEPATRTYRPTLRISFLGHWLQEDEKGDARLLRLVHFLNHKTGQLVALATRNGCYTQYIYMRRHAYPVSHVVSSGALYPLVRSTSGWALIAPLPDREISKLVVRSNHDDRQSAPPSSPRQVLAHVETVRRSGYAFSFGQINSGAGAVAILLPDGAAPDPLVLVVGGAGESFIAHKDEYVELMHEGIATYMRPPPAAPGTASGVLR